MSFSPIKTCSPTYTHTSMWSVKKIKADIKVQLQSTTSSHRFYSKLKNCIVNSVFLLFLFQFTSIRSVTIKKKKRIIIKLIKKNVHVLTHTETSHPGWIWATVLWVPRSALGGLEPRGGFQVAPGHPVLTKTAPVLPGGLWLCCVRLVGVREGLVVLGGLNYRIHSTFQKREQPKAKTSCCFFLYIFWSAQI